MEKNLFSRFQSKLQKCTVCVINHCLQLNIRNKSPFSSVQFFFSPKLKRVIKINRFPNDLSITFVDYNESYSLDALPVLNSYSLDALPVLNSFTGKIINLPTLINSFSVQLTPFM
jgi:hypothetical protein